MRLLITILLCMTSACMTTPIHSPSTPESLAKLIQSNQKIVYVKPSFKSSPKTVGYQYLLFVIPFGKVIIEDLQRDLLKIAEQEFALKGLRMEVLNDSISNQSYYQLSIHSISLNAYDFLFIRKISAHISVELTLFSAGNLELKKYFLQGDSLSYRPFGFQRHLQFEYEKSLKKALSKLN